MAPELGADWVNHDRFIVGNYFNAGGGTTISVTRSMEVYGAWGANALGKERRARRTVAVRWRDLELRRAIRRIWSVQYECSAPVAVHNRAEKINQMSNTQSRPLYRPWRLDTFRIASSAPST